MLVDQGAIQRLNVVNTNSTANKFILFTNDVTITNATTVADLVEASWSGYAAASIGTFTSAAIVSGKARAQAVANPYFVNTESGPVTFYGWAITTSDGSALIAAVNIGETEIPAGGGHLFALSDTMRQDPG